MPVQYKTRDGQTIDLEIPQETLDAVLENERAVAFGRGRGKGFRELLEKLGMPLDPDQSPSLEVVTKRIAERFTAPAAEVGDGSEGGKPATKPAPAAGLNSGDIERLLAKQQAEFSAKLAAKERQAAMAELRGAARAAKIREEDIDLGLAAVERLFEIELDSNGQAMYKDRSTGEPLTGARGLASASDVMALVAKRHPGLVEQSAKPMPGKSGGQASSGARSNLTADAPAVDLLDAGLDALLNGGAE